MDKGDTVRELILQIIHTRMSFRQALQRALRANNIDMTFEMLQVMNRLWRQQGVSQQFLAEQTAKDKTCMTNLINNLETKGWVNRTEDHNDRRNRLIFLTHEGEEMAKSVQPVIHGFYSSLAEQADEKEILRCREALKHIDDLMNII